VKKILKTFLRLAGNNTKKSDHGRYRETFVAATLVTSFSATQKTKHYAFRRDKGKQSPCPI
jgi:hypothetical protein